MNPLSLNVSESSGKIALPVSLISLVIANITPLLGVLFWGWDLFQIFFLYWLESAIIGFYNILKIIKVDGLASTLTVPFFIVHYGGFMLGHLIFIFALFGPEPLRGSFFPSGEIMTPLLTNAPIPLIILVISHGISFFTNFLGKREYRGINAKNIFMAPYKRIVVMHIVIIFGGWLVTLFKLPIFGLLLLVCLKTFADMKAHLKEHATVATA